MSETPDETPDLQPPDTVEDFDAFWQRDPERVQVKIMGDVVALPSSLPLAFEMEARRLARVKGTEGAVVRRLLTLLGFPEGTLQAWVDKGMTVEQLQVLLAWAPARIAGHPVTFEEVRAQLRATTEDDTDGDPGKD